MTKPQRRRLIRASEIGEYVYCRRSWWLRHVAGWTPGRPERLARGQALHQRHGRETGMSRSLLLLGLALVAVALVLALI